MNLCIIVCGGGDLANNSSADVAKPAYLIVIQPVFCIGAGDDDVVRVSRYQFGIKSSRCYRQVARVPDRLIIYKHLIGVYIHSGFGFPP